MSERKKSTSPPRTPSPKTPPRTPPRTTRRSLTTPPPIRRIEDLAPPSPLPTLRSVYTPPPAPRNTITRPTPSVRRGSPLKFPRFNPETSTYESVSLSADNIRRSRASQPFGFSRDTFPQTLPSDFIFPFEKELQQSPRKPASKRGKGDISPYEEESEKKKKMDLDISSSTTGYNAEVSEILRFSNISPPRFSSVAAPPLFLPFRVETPPSPISHIDEPFSAISPPPPSSQNVSPSLVQPRSSSKEGAEEKKDAGRKKRKSTRKTMKSKRKSIKKSKKQRKSKRKSKSKKQLRKSRIRKSKTRRL